jgi:hypothetical protein
VLDPRINIGAGEEALKEVLERFANLLEEECQRGSGVRTRQRKGEGLTLALADREEEGAT